MAKLMDSLLFIVFFIHTFPLFHSRSITTPLSSKTTVLNVTASIENTHKALTHSRNFQPTQQNYYNKLTMTRFGRDSARVKSILTQLDRAVKGINGESESEKLQGTAVSGTSQGSGYYFVRVGIGNPPSFVHMLLDTGNDVSWIQCAPCAECYQQADPIFDPASSASYAPLSCQARQCNALDLSRCHYNNCFYGVSYGDGSFTVGDFVTETITIGSASVSGIAIGCGHDNEGQFDGAAGVLGLGGGSLSLPAQINASSFSYCLVDRDSNSTSTVEFNSPIPLNAVTAPLRRNPGLDTFYYVELNGISVGGELLPIPESSFEVDVDGNGGTIVDSGTTVTWLRSEVYDTLRDAFVMNAYELPFAKSVGLFDTCYDLSSLAGVEVPTVSFHFPEGQVLSSPATNYLIPIDTEGTFCFAFAPTTTALSIIGNVQQQGTRVSFDIANSLVGFSSDSC